MNNFNCNKCVHKNVCAYKEQVPEYKDREADSMFELTLSCKEYLEERLVLRTSDSTIVAPYNQGWAATGTKSQEVDLRPHVY